MGKSNLKLNNKSKGITLIALVITIIVLLILAGVSIATLIGQNGIVTQANTAKTQTEIADAKEQAKLDIVAWQSDKMEKGEDSTLSDSIIKEILIGKDYVKEAKETSFITAKGDHEISYSDLYNKTEIEGNGNIKEYHGNVPIPNGFYYVGGEEDTGLVISDAQEDAGKGTSYEIAQTLVGNQFVWVPVKDDSAFKTYEGYYNKRSQGILSSCEEPYLDGYSTEQAEYEAMKQSVLDHDGFYVARYEASKDEKNITKVASKQGKTVWNNITWGNSMSDIGTEGAVYKSQQMYTNKEKYGVTSTLIYGVQWDSIMSWIDPAYKTGTCDVNNSFVAITEGNGNYSYSIKETGADPNYAKKNIYDLAGNAYEWTMEARGENLRIYRGGTGSNYTGGNLPASGRNGVIPTDNNSSTSFRISLYL